MIPKWVTASHFMEVADVVPGGCGSPVGPIICFVVDFAGLWKTRAGSAGLTRAFQSGRRGEASGKDEGTWLKAYPQL